jgi:hypothetical protein
MIERNASIVDCFVGASTYSFLCLKTIIFYGTDGAKVVENEDLFLLTTVLKMLTHSFRNAVAWKGSSLGCRGTTIVFSFKNMLCSSALPIPVQQTTPKRNTSNGISCRMKRGYSSLGCLRHSARRHLSPSMGLIRTNLTGMELRTPIDQ